MKECRSEPCGCLGTITIEAEGTARLSNGGRSVPLCSQEPSRLVQLKQSEGGESRRTEGQRRNGGDGVETDPMELGCLWEGPWVLY